MRLRDWLCLIRESLLPAGLLLQISLLECRRWSPAWCGAPLFAFGPPASFLTNASRPLAPLSFGFEMSGSLGAFSGATRGWAAGCDEERTTGVAVAAATMMAAAEAGTGASRLEAALAAPSSLK
jgi:hypothetical protein